MKAILVALVLTIASMASTAGAQHASDAHGSALAAPAHVDAEAYKAALANARRIDAKTAARFALVDDYVATSIRMDWLKQVPFPGDEKP